MLKLKKKSTAVQLRPTIEMVEGEGGKKQPVYGDPFPFTLHLIPLKTPELIALQSAVAGVADKEQTAEAYKHLEQILRKSLDGWDGLGREVVEALTSAEIEDAPEDHPVLQASLRVTPQNRDKAVEVIALMAEHNIALYGALTGKILELGNQKKKEAEIEKKI